MTDLLEHLRTSNARDLLAVLAALLRGGGEAARAAELADLPLDAAQAADAIARAFAATA